MRSIDCCAGRNRAGAPAVDQHRAKYVAGEIPPDCGRVPVVAPGHRPRMPPESRRQRRPDDDEIQMAGVVRRSRSAELRCQDRSATRPSRRSSADTLMRAPSRSLRVRLSQNAAGTPRRRAPPTLRQRSRGLSGLHGAGQPSIDSIAASSVTSVSTNIRCCFAIGPAKCCVRPRDPPSTRTYAVRTAATAAAQPSVSACETRGPAYPAPTRIRMSSSRSGRSLKISPLRS